jgi:hypothetical protein
MRHLGYDGGTKWLTIGSVSSVTAISLTKKNLQMIHPKITIVSIVPKGWKQLCNDMSINSDLSSLIAGIVPFMT